MRFDFDSKVVVITGAAGNLGSAVVSEFLKSNAIVCALDHGEGRLESMFSELEMQERLHGFENVDVTDRKGMLNLADIIAAEVGQVEIVVNTVGGFTAGERVDEISAETWHRMMALNVSSLLNTAAAFMPNLIKNNDGKFISIGSKSSLSGSAKTGAYAAAKSAVLRLTESMAAELKSEGIQANCVLPGTIDTPENRQAMPNADFTKWVSPQQIAKAILFLASDDSDNISGIALTVYG